MEVIGDLAHDPVDAEFTEDGGGDTLEMNEHVTDRALWWRGAVLTPHHHRHITRFAIGDPTDLVLVVPRRDRRGLAQLAASHDERAVTTSIHS
jgi:hypothetical protein